MKIYTKNGDNGMTSLFGGRKVSKDALRIDAYGAVDELNSMIGLIRSFKPHSSIDMVLHSIQNDLFVVGADLATPIGIKKLTVMRIQKSHVTALEKQSIRSMQNFRH